MKLLTAPGIAGIAVVRAEAAERNALKAMLRTPAGGALVLHAGAPPRRAALLVGGVVLDDVLVLDRGTRGIEVHVHGAPAILDALQQTFDLNPSSPTSPAEQLFRHAMSREQMELAVEQMGCDIVRFCRETRLLPPVERGLQIAGARRRSDVARAQIEPARIVLVGAQNAGKSSLFNLLLFRERVLTGPQPGLTRDPVAECTMLEGYPYEVVDTAGEGPVLSATDARALDRARAHRIGALLVLVIDGAVGPSSVDRSVAASAALVVANKTDLPAAPWPADVPCHVQLSCAGGDAVRVRREIGRSLRSLRGLPAAGRVGGPAALSVAQALLLEEVADSDRGERWERP